MGDEAAAVGGVKGEEGARQAEPAAAVARKAADLAQDALGQHLREVGVGGVDVVRRREGVDMVRRR